MGQIEWQKKIIKDEYTSTNTPLDEGSDKDFYK